MVCRCFSAPAWGGAHQHPYSSGDLCRRVFLSRAAVRRRNPGSATSREGRMVRRVSGWVNGERCTCEGPEATVLSQPRIRGSKEQQEKNMTSLQEHSIAGQEPLSGSLRAAR